MFLTDWITWITSLVGTAVGIVRGLSRKPFGGVLGLIAAPIAATCLVDLVQQRHSLRRNYLVLARFRWLAEDLRPELRQDWERSSPERFYGRTPKECCLWHSATSRTDRRHGQRR